ncbi:hypothetical protein [Desulfotalea psychrophila]|uniref:Uncharacterized protein n=1 Tax=Desulfotalea psychrophila (strain LSv54 / DSM 12343) TaxID=177439 RepID=Q6AI94_DESPS|nr:hypothetical protein [Desulfotalea psychrophila]CAG37953.1 hypothetical protein DPPB89 [Desulfotalea psychrophila LSv54]
MKNVTWFKIAAILICMMLLPLETAMSAEESPPPALKEQLLAVYHDATAAGVGQEAAMLSAVQTISEQTYKAIANKSLTPLSAEAITALETQIVSEAIVTMAAEVTFENHTDLTAVENILVSAYNHSEGAVVQIDMGNVATATQHIIEVAIKAVPVADKESLTALYHDATAAGADQDTAMVSAVQAVSEQMYAAIVNDLHLPLSTETVVALEIQIVSEAIVALSTEVAAETHTDLASVENNLVDAYNQSEGALVQVSMANVETATQHIAEVQSDAAPLADATPVVDAAPTEATVPVIDESPMPEAITELQEKMEEVLESSEADDNDASSI